MRAGLARRKTFWIALLVSAVLSAGYALDRLDRGWVPHDAGQFGQSAHRTVSGELPHRDFDEMYTGGLTFLNALAFALLGETLVSLRIVLFAVFLIWVPVVYYVASRLASPVTAGAVTLIAAAWSIPTYSAPVPSWYNLFLAVFGIAAVLRYLETTRRRWLFVAGAMGGLSCLVKIVGLYYLAGVGVFLLLLEQERTRMERPAGVRRPAVAYRLIVRLTGAGLAVATLWLLAQRGSPLDLAIFAIPVVAVAGLLAWRETGRADDSRPRLATLAELWGPFLAGAVAPVALFAVSYGLAGGLDELLRAVFVLPQRRLVHASSEVPPFDPVLVLPMLILFASAALLRRRPGVVPVALLAGGLASLLWQSADSVPLYLVAWRPLAFVVPLGVVLAVVSAAGQPPGAAVGDHGLVLLASVTAFFSLIQFPFSASIYFCYTAPLAALLWASLAGRPGAAGRLIGAALLIFYLAFGVLRVTPGFIYAMGRYPAADTLTAPLTLERGRGLRIFPREARLYEELVPLVQRVAGGRPVYAFPDAPEVYFLSGADNPSRTIYDFLADPPISDDDLLAWLNTEGVGTVVINTAPPFSPAISRELLDALRARYPRGRTVGTFEVRWLP